jgi:hypothetical protein
VADERAGEGNCDGVVDKRVVNYKHDDEKAVVREDELMW